MTAEYTTSGREFVTRKNEVLSVEPHGFAIERLHGGVLRGDSFEDAKRAIDAVEEVQKFRTQIAGKQFCSFYKVFEDVTLLNRLPLTSEQRDVGLNNLVEALRINAGRYSPRVADFYLGILAKLIEEGYEPKYDAVRNKLKEMDDSGDFSDLFSGDVSWNTKINRIDKRLNFFLAGMRAFDKREGKSMDDDIINWRMEQLNKVPATPPQRRNESKPGVDPMERLKEGERAPAIWSIYPAWGGYYKEQSFSVWDSQKNVWLEERYTYKDALTVPLSGNVDFKKGPIDITMSAKVTADDWVSVPVPYTHGLHKIEAGGRDFKVKEDQNGDLVIFVQGNADEMVDLKVMLAPQRNKKFTSLEVIKIKIPSMPSEFTEETKVKVEEIKKIKNGNIAQARAICVYVISRIIYLAPKDSAEAASFNNNYRNNPKGFAGAVDELKQADCDVANTYFAALCAVLNIPVRHCVGHSVKGKEKKTGASSITSGTGHGWSEVWDEESKVWVRIDATPPGDPNQQEDEKDNPDSENAPGDFGQDEIGQEATRPSDEQLEKLRQKLADHAEKLSYTKEEWELAEGADVELKEAREIVKEIKKAESTRLPNGELLVDVLSSLFSTIVESRKNVNLVYDGPVRFEEGGEQIQDIVRHIIGILTGDMDPRSRVKPEDENKDEETFGGFDLYIIGDKSGSMVMSHNEEVLWEIQRRAEYLIFSALYRFERNLERSHLQKDNNLSVRTQGISFRGIGQEDIDLDKPLSTQFSAKDKVKMWHSMTGATGSNGDSKALGYVYEQIYNEIGEKKKRRIIDNRLRVVIACSDGGYTGDESVMRELAGKLKELNVVVVGIGLTESAASVPIVMHNPPISYGDIVKDISDLPAMVAKHVVVQAIRLFPPKARKNAMQIIMSILGKFKIGLSTNN